MVATLPSKSVFVLDDIIDGADISEVLLIEEAAEECLHFSRKNQLSFSVGLAEAVLAGWVAPMKSDYQPVDMARLKFTLKVCFMERVCMMGGG